ncbi:MAG TPA: plastocyanin/azurin family copper-binding protein [Gemmatimonadales bacterium]|nr:plastocyanin/azurin family copper-binding protein [Gemmatimonadales bacterium]
MRSLASILGVAAFAFACSSSSTSSAANCASSGAAATISASDGLTFGPSSATITHGQSVCWQNTGAIAHTVTSNDNTSFNSNLAGGAMFQHTFPTAGAFPYRCTIHPGMAGTITVN